MFVAPCAESQGQACPKLIVHSEPRRTSWAVIGRLGGALNVRLVPQGVLVFVEFLLVDNAVKSSRNNCKPHSDRFNVLGIDPKAG